MRELQERHWRAVLVGLAGFLLTLGAGAVEYINDALTSSTFPGRGSKGGTFGPGGWTTVDEPDSIWYEIPDALPTGVIQYTVTGISVSGSQGGRKREPRHRVR